MTPWKDEFSRRPVAKPDSESDGWGRGTSTEVRGGGLSDAADIVSHAPSSAEERWLGSYLRRAYDDVVAEPLPDSFDDLLRRLQDDDGDPGAPARSSAETR